MVIFYLFASLVNLIPDYKFLDWSKLKTFADDKRNVISLFPKQAPGFTCLQYKPFGNTVGKGEIARNEQFLLFP